MRSTIVFLAVCATILYGIGRYYAQYAPKDTVYCAYVPADAEVYAWIEESMSSNQ